MPFSHRFVIGALYTTTIILLAIFAGTMWLFSQPAINTTQSSEPVQPFPVGVDPLQALIFEHASVTAYRSDELAISDRSTGPLAKAAAHLTQYDWYQQLASPVGRIIVIWPGERKEELTNNIGDIMRWSDAQREEFVDLVSDAAPAQSEGKFYPGRYVTHRHATPQDIAGQIHGEFVAEIASRYPDELDSTIPLTDVLTIASLLEREASDFTNMREVSGVIWNRLFIDMPLQLDATLQYAKANDPAQPSWWPVPRPADKFLDSPYNTYQNTGLPPGPIANVSAEAVLAALNPRQTDCLFYFHDRSQDYHCSVTYEEHVRKLRANYGRGR